MRFLNILGIGPSDFLLCENGTRPQVGVLWIVHVQCQ